MTPTINNVRVVGATANKPHGFGVLVGARTRLREIPRQSLPASAAINAAAATMGAQRRLRREPNAVAHHTSTARRRSKTGHLNGAGSSNDRPPQ